jgi:hypothetical protein
MRAILFVMLLLGLSACATQGVKQAEVKRITPEELAKISPAPTPSLSLDEIVTMSQSGKSPDEIIAQIKASQSRYELSTEQTLDLSKKGVATAVLTYINEANALAKQNAIADEMNKRAKERSEAEKILRRERDMMQRQRYFDPFFGPMPFGIYPNIWYRHHRSRFGTQFIYPFYW